MFASMLALSGVGMGIYYALQSSLFVVQSVEVQSSTDDPPVNDATIIRLADIRLGKISLFTIDFGAAERRLLANDWIKEVKFRKTYAPHQAALIISVTYRKPEAIVVRKEKLSYVDAGGRILGPVKLLNSPDLPILTGFGTQNSNRIREVIQFIHRWEGSQLNQISSIASTHWDPEGGYRMLVRYGSQIHAVVELGQDVDENIENRLGELHSVFHYLKENSIAVRRIWADVGKKVVVKTVHGS